jgi:hypothetical protein
MLSLRPYQETAADFLYERDRAMVLAPMGAGKTATALTAMRDAVRDKVVARWLVIAPLRVCRYVWPVEATTWAPDIKVALAIGTEPTRYKALHAPVQVVVTNYDSLQWLAKQQLDFDGVVFDELTRLKNPSGKRFKAFLKAIEHIGIRWGLTGSFTSNGLEDVFGQCKIIDQSLLGRSKGAFLQQYFHCINRDHGQWEPARGSLEQVMARIKHATFVLEPGEYADTLPPLHITVLRTDLGDRAPYEKMKRDFVVQFPDAQAVAANAGAVTQKLQQMSCGWVYDTRKTPNPAKPGKFIVTQTPVWFSAHKFDLLEEVLDGNQRANTIVAYTYVEEQAELLRRYPHAATIDQPGVVDRWNRGEVPLLLIHPRSAGHGLNLQHGGCRMVFLSLPWSLEEYEQTVGRLHRSGQRQDVWVYVLLANQTIDERIWSALHDKRAVSDIAMKELTE